MMETSSPEQELIRAAQRGSISAFSELVRRHQQAVRTCLAVRLSNPHEAEDLAQDVFVTAFERMAEFDVNRPLAPWLRGIAMNLLRNYLRKFRAEGVGGHEELGHLLDERVAAECNAERETALQAALLDCLDEIDGPSRELLRLRYADGVSVRDLSVRLHKGYSALTMQLHRLRSVMAVCVQGKVSANRPS